MSKNLNTKQAKGGTKPKNKPVYKSFHFDIYEHEEEYIRLYEAVRTRCNELKIPVKRMFLAMLKLWLFLETKGYSIPDAERIIRWYSQQVRKARKQWKQTTKP